MTTDFSALFRALAGTDFILIGGLAAAVHGAARATYDVDVLYSRTPDNVGRLVAALAPLRPYAARRQACRSRGTPTPSRTV